MHRDIKLHFYAEDTQLFIHMSHTNAALAFDKLNSCLLDLQEWMSSSMLKLNPDNTEFIICGFHAQLKKLDPYLPVRTFVNYVHPLWGWTYYFCFSSICCLTSDVQRHTSLPLILRKSYCIRAIFTKFGTQDYWVSVLLGISAVVALLLTE